MVALNSDPVKPLIQRFLFLEILKKLRFGEQVHRQLGAKVVIYF